MPFGLIHHNYTFLLVIIVLPIVSGCDRRCGGKTVPYPFGFSANCKIRLNCTHGQTIKIGNFAVRNVTGDSILVTVPPDCNRSIDSIRQLSSPSYGLTSKNGLILLGCLSAPSCEAPPLIDGQLSSDKCVKTKGNVTCFTSKGKSIMRFDNVTGKQCQHFFSGFAVDSSKVPVVAVDLSTVELEWWVEGKCGVGTACVRNALCSQSTGGRGFRCKCQDGFEGDGFADGSACQKKSLSCNPSNYMNGHCGGKNRFAVLIGGVVAGASIVAALSLLCYFVRRRSSSLRTHISARRLLSEAAGPCSIPFYPYRDIERATNSFSEKNRLGTGAYGTVYVGKLRNDKEVAVKKLRQRDNDSIEQVLNEIKLLSSVSHANLVQLLGCCIERGEQILVYEFMSNGTLSQHLQRERGIGLSWTTRLTIAVDTAKAIAHLHSASPPIFHRDIKSSNILLDDKFNSKVADFGLSRMGMMESSHISTAPQGTPGYVDPQYHQNFHLSDKSDVYSFGVVLVEIITALKVVDFSREQSEVNLAALAIDKIGKGCIDEIIDPFLEPHEDAWTLSSIHKVAELAFRCLAFHRDMRPSMMEVAAELEQIRLSGWAPVEEMFAGSSASSCSSLSYGSEYSRTTTKKSVGSRRLMVPQRSERVILLEEVAGSSPVSVQDPWLSEQSSPSSNSLLGHVVQ